MFKDVNTYTHYDFNKCFKLRFRSYCFGKAPNTFLLVSFQHQPHELQSLIILHIAVGCACKIWLYFIDMLFCVSDDECTMQIAIKMNESTQPVWHKCCYRWTLYMRAEIRLDIQWETYCNIENILVIFWAPVWLSIFHRYGMKFWQHILGYHLAFFRNVWSIAGSCSWVICYTILQLWDNG